MEIFDKAQCPFKDHHACVINYGLRVFRYALLHQQKDGPSALNMYEAVRKFVVAPLPFFKAADDIKRALAIEIEIDSWILNDALALVIACKMYVTSLAPQKADPRYLAIPNASSLLKSTLALDEIEAVTRAEDQGLKDPEAIAAFVSIWLAGEYRQACIFAERMLSYV